MVAKQVAPAVRVLVLRLVLWHVRQVVVENALHVRAHARINVLVDVLVVVQEPARVAALHPAEEGVDKAVKDRVLPLVHLIVLRPVQTLVILYAVEIVESVAVGVAVADALLDAPMVVAAVVVNIVKAHAVGLVGYHVLTGVLAEHCIVRAITA